MKKFLIVIAVILLCLFGWQFLRGVNSGLVHPLMNDLAVRNEVVKGLEAARPFQTAVSQRYSSDSFVCTSNENCNVQDVSARTFSIAIGPHAAITVALDGINPNVDGRTVVLKPHKNGKSLIWDCRGGTLQPLYRPASCRPKPTDSN